MRKIIGIRDNPESNMFVELEQLPENTPIFVKNKNSGKFIGMVIQESEEDLIKDHWAIHIGGKYILSGYHKTRLGCLKSVADRNFEFYTEL